MAWSGLTQGALDIHRSRAAECETVHVSQSVGFGGFQMIALSRSKTAMSLIFAAASLFVLSYALSGLAYVIVSATNPTPSQDLANADLWLAFAGSVLALGAVGIAASRLSSDSESRTELSVAFIATLLLAVGFLIAAANPNVSSTTAEVLTAIGVGGWSILVAWKATGRSAAGASDVSQYLRVAAIGLLLVAIGQGLPASQFGNVGPGVVGQILTAIGIVILAASISMAGGKGALHTSQVPVLVLGLSLLAIGFLAFGIAAGLVFTSTSTSLTGLRVGLSIPTFVVAVGFALLGRVCGSPRCSAAG